MALPTQPPAEASLLKNCLWLKIKKTAVLRYIMDKTDNEPLSWQLLGRVYKHTTCCYDQLHQLPLVSLPTSLLVTETAFSKTFSSANYNCSNTPLHPPTAFRICAERSKWWRISLPHSVGQVLPELWQKVTKSWWRNLESERLREKKTM